MKQNLHPVLRLYPAARIRTGLVSLAAISLSAGSMLGAAINLAPAAPESSITPDMPPLLMLAQAPPGVPAPPPPAPPPGARGSGKAVMHSSGGGGGGATAAGVDETGTFWTARYGGAPRANDALVARSTHSSAEDLAAMEEDLNVMSRLFEKALDDKKADRQRMMGIDLMFWQSQQPRSLYLENYGAVFTFKVRFPLMPPPAKAEEEKSSKAPASAWEETRRELYGRREFTLDLDRSVKAIGALQREEYSAERVQRLKDQMIETLKQATNMRIKPDESVTVIVLSDPETPGEIITRRFSEGYGRRNAMEQEARTAQDTKPASPRNVMTVKAKKSDIDDFSGGKIDLEQFKGKVTLLVY